MTIVFLKFCGVWKQRAFGRNAQLSKILLATYTAAFNARLHFTTHAKSASLVSPEIERFARRSTVRDDPHGVRDTLRRNVFDQNL